jgi:hypothetical protein
MKTNQIVKIVSDLLKIEQFLLQNPTLKIKILDCGVDYDDNDIFRYGEILLQVGENEYETELCDSDEEDIENILNFLNENNISANLEIIITIFSVIDYYITVEECFGEFEINVTNITMGLSTIKTLINIHS